MTAANEKPDCPHKHTGSCSPDGVYLYVRCMDCWEILMMSDEGKRRLSECPGYEPPKQEFGRHCIHCDFDFWDHERRAQPTEEPIGWYHAPNTLVLNSSHPMAVTDIHGMALYVRAQTPIPHDLRCPWLGCGECDEDFPCFEGRARCFRLAPEITPKESL